MPRASLPMYAFPALEAANDALWGRARAGVAAAPERLEAADSVPEAITPDTLFTQVCGFPLFRRFLGQGLILGVPRYGFEGCQATTHRAAFIVRAEEPGRSLTALRGRVFGCNSIHSNTGMNLPRLSLARVAGGQRFFSRVAFTGAHLASLRALATGAIDLCAVDCVTWGLARRYLPEVVTGLRVLAWTEPSPCLPFVTSVTTPRPIAAALASNLLGQTESGLGLVGIEATDPAAYAILVEYEREAAERGYTELA